MNASDEAPCKSLVLHPYSILLTAAAWPGVARRVAINPRSRSSRLELQLPGIVANHAHIRLGKASRRLDLDIQGERHPGAWRSLKLHHDCVENGV